MAMSDAVASFEHVPTPVHGHRIACLRRLLMVLTTQGMLYAIDGATGGPAVLVPLPETECGFHRSDDLLTLLLRLADVDERVVDDSSASGGGYARHLELADQHGVVLVGSPQEGDATGPGGRVCSPLHGGASSVIPGKRAVENADVRSLYSVGTIRTHDGMIYHVQHDTGVRGRSIAELVVG